SLALLVAVGLRHTLLQVQSLLERPKSRPAPTLRVGAGNVDDRGKPGPPVLECLHLVVPRLGPVDGPMLPRPGPDPSPPPGAEPECLGAVVPLGWPAGFAPGRDGQHSGRGGSGAEPGRALGPGRPPIGRPRDGQPRCPAGHQDRPTPIVIEARTAAGDRLAC